MKKILALFLIMSALVFMGATQVSNRMWKDTATGSGAVSSTVAPGVAWRIDSVRIHLSAAGGAGDLTATIDAGAGSAYDVVILTQDMTSVTDFVWFPDRDLIFTSTDELDIAWANGSSRTYGLEVYYVKLN